MVRRFTLILLITSLTVFTLQAEVRFSIRYQDKNIYYPGDKIELKITISNPEDSDGPDFYLADDTRQSFGFDLRSLTGEPMPLAEGFAAALNDKGAYRVVHLARGQELSITVHLNDWVDLSTPGQYRLTTLFYPRMRGDNSAAVQADSVLDLTLMPDTERPWEDELDQDVRRALIRRNLDPWSIVNETIQNRKNAHFNRAMLYLDFESLSRISSSIESAESLEKELQEGSWNSIPGFEHPVTSVEFSSSQSFRNESSVRIKAIYEPYGEQFVRDLRFYLHNPEGYWQIRRVEAISDGDVNPVNYGRLDLEPQEVVTELLNAVTRGDWEIALRYIDTADLVRNQPEYQGIWKDMSSTEHRRALSEYTNKLISGQLDESQEPLKDIDDWKITRVSYTESEGTIIVENTKAHNTANGLMSQNSEYTFRLVKTSNPEGRWLVARYDASMSRR